MSKKEETQTLIRLPQSLLNEVRQLAEAHDRSLNGEMVWALREYVKQQKGGEKDAGQPQDQA
ncbi:MAG TPA: Arc family DNA-binding protein [Ktedonobacteraceae bacterium]|nr:Arc family DNA-binding protein [Ktedonobacteraceae bacterium]